MPSAFDVSLVELTSLTTMSLAETYTVGGGMLKKEYEGCPSHRLIQQGTIIASGEEDLRAWTPKDHRGAAQTAIGIFDTAGDRGGRR